MHDEDEIWFLSSRVEEEEDLFSSRFFEFAV